MQIKFNGKFIALYMAHCTYIHFISVNEKASNCISIYSGTHQKYIKSSAKEMSHFVSSNTDYSVLYIYYYDYFLKDSLWSLFNIYVNLYGRMIVRA